MEKQQHTLQEGQKVRIKTGLATTAGVEGQVGTIHNSKPHSLGHFMVRMDSGHILPFFPNELEILEDDIIPSDVRTDYGKDIKAIEVLQEENAQLVSENLRLKQALANIGNAVVNQLKEVNEEYLDI